MFSRQLREEGRGERGRKGRTERGRKGRKGERRGMNRIRGKDGVWRERRCVLQPNECVDEIRMEMNSGTSLS